MLLSKELKGDVDLDDRDDANTRQCTDPCCSVIFVAFFVFMLKIHITAHALGDERKLLHGIDWQDRICGVDEGVFDKPLLYWCAGLTDGICIEECPTEDNLGEHACPGASYKSEITPTNPDAKAGYNVSFTVTRKVQMQRDEPSINLLGMYCIPKDPLMAKAILEQGALKGKTTEFIVALRNIQSNWVFLCGIAIVSLALSFAFIYLLALVVWPMVVTILALFWIILATASGYFFYGGFSSPPSGLFAHYFKEDVARTWSLSLGGVFLVLVLLYSVFIACGSQAISNTCRSIKKACKTFQSMPTLVLEPVARLFMYIVVLYQCFDGVLFITSMGHVVPSQAPLQSNTGLSVSGIGRHVEMENWQIYYLAYWAFGSLWLVELVTALGQYALSHAVVLFTLNKDESCRCLPLTQGYLNGIMFHFGTLAFGSFVIGVMKALTMVAAYLGRQVTNQDGTMNMAVKAACCCCLCCLHCLKDLMEMVNEMVYVNTAIQGHSYITSAKEVVRMITKYPETVAMIQGMTRAVRYLGTTIIGALGTYLAYCLLTTSFMENTLSFQLQETAPELHASTVWGLVIASGLISVSIGNAFMVTFDTIADTICYCVLWQQEKGVGEDGYDAVEAYSKLDSDDDE